MTIDLRTMVRVQMKRCLDKPDFILLDQCAWYSGLKPAAF